MKPFNKMPYAVDLAYLLVASLLLLLTPASMREVFRAMAVPDYLVRMCGALVIALAGVVLHAVKAQDTATLQCFGIIQLVFAGLCSVIIWTDHAPSTFWVFVSANTVLGSWILLSAWDARPRNVTVPGAP